MMADVLEEPFSTEYESFADNRVKFFCDARWRPACTFILGLGALTALLHVPIGGETAPMSGGETAPMSGGGKQTHDWLGASRELCANGFPRSFVWGLGTASVCPTIEHS
jgi:hypothetical protein